VASGLAPVAVERGATVHTSPGDAAVVGAAIMTDPATTGEAATVGYGDIVFNRAE
jgi:hypothetical protein